MVGVNIIWQQMFESFPLHGPMQPSLAALVDDAWEEQPVGPPPRSGWKLSLTATQQTQQLRTLLVLQVCLWVERTRLL